MGPILTDADPPMLGQLQAFGLLVSSRLPSMLATIADCCAGKDRILPGIRPSSSPLGGNARLTIPFQRRTGSHSRQDSIRLLLDCRLLTGDALHHSRLHLKPIV